MAMMMALMLAAATQGVAPRELNAEQVTSHGVSEDSRLPSDRDGIAFVMLTLDPVGRPIHCAVAKSSGFRALDSKTCATLTHYARFLPARDESGQPVASAYPTAMRGGVGVSGAPGYMIDMSVEVSKLPSDTVQPVAAVRQVLAADGTLESCEIERSSGSDKLDRLACRQAEGLAKLGPVKDAGGAPVRTLRVSRILFVERPRQG